jgi:predicted PurR-regulated permease PerM
MNKDGFSIIDIIVRLGFVLLVGIWCFTILRPFIGVMLWGMILAVALYPIFQWLKNCLGGRKNLAATLIALISIFIILGPVGIMAKSLADSINNLAIQIANGTLTVPAPPEDLENLPMIGDKVNRLWEIASVNLKEALKILEPQLTKLTPSLLSIAGNVGLAVIQFIFSIIIAVGFILNSKAINRHLTSFFERLTPTQGDKFIELAASTLRNVIRGVIGIAAIQTLLIGIGMILAGIPYAGILTLLCLVLTIIQIGPGLIVIASIIFAWSKMSTFVALLYTLWMIPAMLIDNFLKPVLMARGLPIPMLVIFIGVFGGTLAQGIIGLFIGPVVLGFGYELLGAWVYQDKNQLPVTNEETANIQQARRIN